MADHRLAVVELVTWRRASRLWLGDRLRPWYHVLDQDDYLAVLDPTDYTVAPAGP